MSGDYVGLRGYRQLSLDEQSRLMELARGRGSLAERAMDVCVRSNMGLVFRVVNDERAGVDVDDLVQEGAIGLWRAVRTYDPVKSKFSAYAHVCVQRRVKAALGAVYPVSSLEQDISGEADFGDNAEAVRSAVKRLPLLERFVIMFHYGLHSDRPQSLRELSRVMRRSYETVRKIELRGLERLKGILSL